MKNIFIVIAMACTAGVASTAFAGKDCLSLYACGKIQSSATLNGQVVCLGSRHNVSAPNHIPVSNYMKIGKNEPFHVDVSVLIGPRNQPYQSFTGFQTLVDANRRISIQNYELVLNGRSASLFAEVNNKKVIIGNLLMNLDPRPHQTWRCN